MNDAIIAAVRAHAAQEAPRECCGVVIVRNGQQRYRPCRNVAGDDREFEFHPEDLADAEDAGEIVAVCHSHVNLSPQPSMADKAMCELTGVPWLIVNHPLGHCHEFAPTGFAAPLVGREFSHGVLDCYTLVRDYYGRTLGITVPDFARPDRWWASGLDLYRDNFAVAGFDAIPGASTQAVLKHVRPHDVLLMQFDGPVPHHAGIYLGDMKILHHLMNRLSSRDVYGGYWQQCTTHVLRHRTLA